jgi:trk system potassium uptake protein TrkH
MNAADTKDGGLQKLFGCVRNNRFAELLKKHILSAHPAQIAVFGYLSYIIVGWLLLCLPFVQKGAGVNVLDNLFISTSAVSTTGLVTTSVADNYNLAGQIIILVLIQLGGIGYMTFGSFIMLSRAKDLSDFRANIGHTVFSLPKAFRIDKFIKSVITFTVIIEAVGAVLLYIIFTKAGQNFPIWTSIFHSVSAFCTAGFGLYNNSFEDFSANFYLNAVIAILSYMGAIGFIVWVDVWRKIIGKTQRITLTSKIILNATFWLSAIGAILLFVSEPTITSRPTDERIITSLFQSMTAMTTVGFNTIPIGQISKASLLLIITLMVIGASPSGTGGGLKSTTFSVIIGVMRSALSGEHEVRFWGRRIPIERVWTAVASLGFYLAALIVGTYLLEMTEQSPFAGNLFEAASALGTVGLSTGITSQLTDIGKLIIIALMFCGRLGPLTFSIALFLPGKKAPLDDDVAV